jgi:AraC family transcriptional regulator of arabinose operon
MSAIRLGEGFLGQRQYVIPRPVIESSKNHPLLHALLPTDVGWYPQARFHYRVREDGATENILILCVEGSGWYEIADRHREIKQNEALLIPKGIPHTYAASYETPWSIHWVHFIGQEAAYFAHQVTDDSYTISVDSATVEVLEKTFTQMYDAFVGGFVLKQLIFAAKLLHSLLGNLFFDNLAFSPMLRTSQFHNLESTLTYMKQHLHDSLTVEDMSAHAGFSKSHFSRLFKEQTGFPPMDYFIRLKIQYACSLLDMTDKSIREISTEIGYDDPYYFSRLFKKVMDVSPRHYRTIPRG